MQVRNGLRAPGSVPGNGHGSKIVKLQWQPKKARRPPSSWKCQMSSRRFLSSNRTARDFRKAADGDAGCSTTKQHLTSSLPIPAPQTADTRTIRPLRRRTKSSTRTRSVGPCTPRYSASDYADQNVGVLDGDQESGLLAPWAWHGQD